MALLQVALVTIGATVAIATLMSAANWAFTPVAGADTVTGGRRILGFVLLCVTGLLIIFGLYLMIPYFRS
ncbi:MAG: hypothetical protein FWD55_03095 [Propionibacteriaceae bacterium]|nr:hypothetical protein [Propionibacteriaceae bacterium]